MKSDANKTSLENRIDRFLYKRIVEPFHLLCSFVFIGLIVVSIVAPFAYLFFEALHWLNRGRWFDNNVCSDLGWLCPEGDLLGLDKIFVWISDRPFIFLCLCSAIVVTIVIGLMEALEESIKRSKNRFEEQSESEPK